MQTRAHLLSHKRFFYRRKVLQGRKQHVSELWTADILDELAQFLAQGCEHLILVLDRFYAQG